MAHLMVEVRTLTEKHEQAEREIAGRKAKEDSLMNENRDVLHENRDLMKENRDLRIEITGYKDEIGKLKEKRTEDTVKRLTKEFNDMVVKIP